MRQKPQRRAQKAGLARAIGAKKAHEFPLFHGQIDLIDHRACAAPHGQRGQGQ
jgi:hypothetical protein